VERVPLIFMDTFLSFRRTVCQLEKSCLLI